ncbi:Spy/CpxP family protein refolding chaperone [Phenylobacterium sp.]|uniref:Spy/CpxP family protein refolding chaperone n=1 Tax=Phenylobacterium sp. TaxID=1871053 RepID=UPI0035AE5F51
MPRPAAIWSGVVLAAACAATALAAEPMHGPGGPPPPGGPKSERPEPPSNEQRAAKLKAMLQLSPSQGAAADAFVVATAPPDPEDLPKPDREKLEAMSTPERLDQMDAMHKEAEQHMAKVEAATRAFYSSLTPSQKAAFDALPPQTMMGFAGGPPPMGPRERP